MVDINPDTVLENQYRISIYNIEILRHIKTSDESRRRQRRQGSLAMFGRGGSGVDYQCKHAGGPQEARRHRGTSHRADREQRAARVI